jgi:hypothetical protein
MDVNINLSSENDICSICLEENIEEEVVSTTNCSHSFCNKCLEDWLNKGKYSCPLCRKDIKTFITNDKETRILPVRVGSDMPIIDNIPNRNLAYANARLKYSLYLSLAVLVILGNYYTRSRDDYSDLFDKYNQCVTNLTTYQDTCHDLVESAFYDSAYHSLKICTIPQYYYNKCFH